VTVAVAAAAAAAVAGGRKVAERLIAIARAAAMRTDLRRTQTLTMSARRSLRYVVLVARSEPLGCWLLALVLGAGCAPMRSSRTVSEERLPSELIRAEKLAGRIVADVRVEESAVS
jgi:hypothetical protein